MSHAREILIATGNPGKRREIQAVTAGLPVTWKTLTDFPSIESPPEVADTFAGNAADKARFYSKRTGLWSLADDSGLEVDALDGQPGILSARFAGEDANDAANNAKLLRLLKSVPQERRTARFRCAIALADGDDILLTAAGSVEGLIVDEPHGRNGFGYDPLFWIPPYRQTAAQMPAELKNRVSHRGQALADLRSQLKALLEAG
jgi:XTP/dITP diphosphohydrolase